MSTPHRYLGFGLKIASEIEFPELFAGGDGEPDLWIRHGMEDETLFEGFDPRKVWHEFLPDRFRLNIPDVGRYLARSGEVIHFLQAPGADLSTARVYVLTVTMAALLMQKGRILLHASGIVSHGRVHLFMGESGSGKSSLMAELRRRGYAAFTDDVCVVSSSDAGEGTVVAHASYPMMKLLPESIRAIDDERYDYSHRIWPDEEKFGQFFHEEFTTDALPVAGIRILNPRDGHTGGYLEESLGGIEAFKMLTGHTYRKQFMHEISLAGNHAILLSKLVSQVPVCLVTRSPKDSDIHSFADFTASSIEKD
jgi:hypothetical protein